MNRYQSHWRRLSGVCDDRPGRPPCWTTCGLGTPWWSSPWTAPRPVAVRGDPYRGDADGGRRAAAVAAGGDRLLHPGRLRARADARAGGGGGPPVRPTARSAHRPAAEALRSLGPPGPRPAPGRGVDLRAGAQLRRFARHRLPRPATGPGRGGNPSRRDDENCARGGSDGRCQAGGSG